MGANLSGKMQVPASSGYTMVLFRRALLRPKILKAYGGHALREAVWGASEASIWSPYATVGAAHDL
jgi:hypothetical protein